MLVASLLVPSACKRKLPAELSALELAEPPPSASMPLRIGAELGDALELLGAKLTPEHGLKPGSRVEVTLYWRKKAAIEPGYRLFTHVVDEAGEPLLNLDQNGPLRASSGTGLRLPPSAWEVGKVYVDALAFWVPTTVRTDSISLLAGCYRDAERLRVTAAPRGALRSRTGSALAPPADSVLVATLPLTRAIAPSAAVLPTLWVPWRSETTAIVLDGKLDEAAWSRAAFTGAFLNVSTGEPAAGNLSASAKLLWDRQALYVGVEVFDEDVRGGFDPNQPDPHLWLKDAVEIMVDPDGDGDNRDYYEIQVGPQNLVFDSQFDAYNLPHVDPDGPYGHQDWSAHLTSGVSVQGTLDDDREDEGYVVELAIPWSSFDKAKRVPPQSADTWRMNFYAMQNNGGVAWSPILGQGNFHKAARFGRVRFLDPPAGPASTANDSLRR